MSTIKVEPETSNIKTNLEFQTKELVSGINWFDFIILCIWFITFLQVIYQLKQYIYKPAVDSQKNE